MALAFVNSVPGQISSAALPPTSAVLRGAASAEIPNAVPSSLPQHAPLSALVLGVSGGALAASRRSSVARHATKKAGFEPAEQVGAMAPLGYFDPLGFCPSGDEQNFNILRAAEIKHGRVAMLASVGLLAQHFAKLPGVEKSGIGALNSPNAQWWGFALFAWCGVVEYIIWEQKEDSEPGNFGDPLGLGMYDTDMRSKEINNGRFAMIAVVGILGAELATGKDAIQQFGL